MRDRIAPDKAGSEEHNGHIWSRSPTPYGTILAAKIVLFLLGISIKRKYGEIAVFLRNHRTFLSIMCATSQKDDPDTTERPLRRGFMRNTLFFPEIHIIFTNLNNCSLHCIGHYGIKRKRDLFV